MHTVVLFFFMVQYFPHGFVRSAKGCLGTVRRQWAVRFDHSKPFSPSVELLAGLLILERVAVLHILLWAVGLQGKLL